MSVSEIRRWKRRWSNYFYLVKTKVADIFIRRHKLSKKFAVWQTSKDKHSTCKTNSCLTTLSKSFFALFKHLHPWGKPAPAKIGWIYCVFLNRPHSQILAFFPRKYTEGKFLDRKWHPPPPFGKQKKSSKFLGAGFPDHLHISRTGKSLPSSAGSNFCDCFVKQF